MIEGCKRHLARARRRVLRLQPIHPEPFATHLPVLVALARVTPVRHVLELGSGPFSTKLFLNRRVFQDLERIESYEDDVEWESVVLQATGSDARLDLRLVDAVRDSVPTDLGKFDLIFIDDSRSSPERTQTILTVAERRPEALVVIHDYETRAYRRIARKFDHRLVCKAYTPQVGLAWNGTRWDRAEIRRAVESVQSGVALDVVDVDGWLEHLKRTHT